ncbi:MAG: response regulator [Candidatus Scalindua sp.]|nr:response regulator [Candidatus Scalindua sp.]
MAKKILIVEDEQTFHDLYNAIFEGTDYDLVFAYDGDEALMKLEQTRPDLIMLDILMDMVTGDTFFLHLKGMPEFENIPVIIISAFSEKEYKSLKKIDPNLVFIEKPHLTREKLIEEVDRKIKTVR